MRTLARQTLVTVALAGVAASAFAQGQSSASAHGFFQAIARAQPMLVTDFTGAAPQTRDVVAVASSGCLTRVTWQAPGQPPMESTLDWKSIQNVRVEGERDLRLRGRGLDTVLGLPSRELAIRLGNALTLIHRECDPLAGFGF